jgi:hypothetical protein
MSDLKEVEVFLTGQQFKKLNRGESIQLKSKQLCEPSQKENHHVGLSVSNAVHKKMMRHSINGKGLRVTSQMVHGCDFFGKIGDYAIKQAMNNDTVKNLALKGANMAGKMVAKKLGVNPDYVDKATNMASNYLKSKSLAPLPVAEPIEESEPIEGEGFRRGTASAKQHAKLMRAKQSSTKHFVKGSAEAKAHMAQLRAMRGKKTGKGLFGNILKGAKKLAGNKQVQGIAGQVLKKGLAMTPIGALVPTSVTDGLIDQGVSAGGNAVAGSGFQGKSRLTSNVYSPIVGGTGPIVRRGGSFLELGR